MRRKAEEASEAEAEFKMERRGGRGFPLHKGMFLVFEGGGKGKNMQNTRNAVFLVFHMKGETVSHTKFVS